MPIGLKLVVAFSCFAIFEAVLSVRSKVAIFGVVLNDEVSLAVVLVNIFLVTLITIGIVRRVRLAAVAYIVYLLIGTLCFLGNWVLLEPDEIKQITGEVGGEVPMYVVAALIAGLFLLILPVIWHREYFR